MAKLKLTRSSEWINRWRAIGVYIDGQKMGTIYNGETKEFDIPAGDHVLKTKIDWCSSRDCTVSVSENETKNLTLSSFGYSYHFMAITTGILALHFFLTIVFKIEYLAWLLIPAFGALVYYITIGRNDYLVVKKDSMPFS